MAPALVYACHGGAGATTISRLTGASHDLGTSPPLQLIQLPLVLVARRSAAGCLRLTRAAAHFASMGYAPIAVAVGDGPWPDPVAARMRLKMLRGRGVSVIRMPYVPYWRHLDDVLEHAARHGVPQQAHRAVARLRAELVGQRTGERR